MSEINLNDFFTNSNELFVPKPKVKRAYDEVFNFERGQKYLVRILPYLKEGKEGYQKTSFQFQQYAWRSCVDGRWVYVQSPRSFNEPCPITDWFFKAKNSKNEEIQDKVKKLSDNYRRYVYYNIYIVNDPVNPDNNGKVKILRAGKQLDDIIKAALSNDQAAMDDYKEELGVDNMRQAVFDLGPNGVNLCVDCQDQGGFPNYKSSRFVARKRDLGLSDDQQKEIYNSVFDLTTINRKFTTEQAAKVFTETFLGHTFVETTSEPKTSSNHNNDEYATSAPTSDSNIDEVDIDSLADELERGL